MSEKYQLTTTSRAVVAASSGNLLVDAVLVSVSMTSWKDSARSVGASSGASVHLSSEYDMARVLSLLAEDDDDEEFPGEHAGSSAAGRMVVPPIDAMHFVTESKSLAYELY